MPDGSTRTCAVEKQVVRIGRASDNDIVLADTNRSVSRWHAVIKLNDDGSMYVEDLESKNKTRVNGEPVDGPVRIRPNDVIAVGAFKISLQGDPSAYDEFTIQTSTIRIDELQKKPGLFTFAQLDSKSPGELNNLELLYEVGVTLARSRSIAEVTQAAVELLFRIDKVHRATVIRWDHKSNSFNSLDLHTRTGGRLGSVAGASDPKNIVMSRTILGKVRAENRPLLIRYASASSLEASIVGAGIQAAFCSPLTCHERFLGILYADNLADPDAFSEQDFRMFTSIATQTSLALASAIASEEVLQREVERQTLKRYLPQQVADLIIASGGASQFNGELHSVAVLYADIRGFSAMSQRMEAREIVTMLREFFSVMNAAILECNGTLDKLIGDCIMALFGAPLPSEHATRDALRTAILMQQRMHILNETRVHDNAPPIRIGIGLHCGPAVVGNIGSEDRVQYTAIGDTVNLAARLVHLAAPSQIIVSEEVRSAAANDAEFEPLDEVELKGRAAKTNIYSVKWAGDPSCETRP